MSGAIGLVIFAAYPVAPPRLIGMGFNDTVTTFSQAYKADIDAIHEQITNSPTIGVDAKAGWEQVKGEFDNIDTVF